MNNQTINIKHTGKIGDCLFGLPACASYGDCNLYLSKERGEFTDKSIKFLLPLLNKQPYINKAAPFEKPQRIDIDLTLFRYQSDLKYSSLSWVQLLTFHRYFDTTKPWIFNIESKHKADIIITRTRRYYGYFDWDRLINEVNSKHIAFIGLDEEYKKFCSDFKTIKRIEVNNALEAASIIKGSKMFIGNQGGMYTLAESMKVPRILSICPDAPNHPSGGDLHISYEDKDLIQVVKKHL